MQLCTKLSSPNINICSEICRTGLCILYSPERLLLEGKLCWSDVQMYGRPRPSSSGGWKEPGDEVERTAQHTDYRVWQLGRAQGVCGLFSRDSCGSAHLNQLAALTAVPSEFTCALLAPTQSESGSRRASTAIHSLSFQILH